jgi:hypothetical protein
MNDDLPPKDHKDTLNNNFPPVGKTVRSGMKAANAWPTSTKTENGEITF